MLTTISPGLNDGNSFESQTDRGFSFGRYILSPFILRELHRTHRKTALRKTEFHIRIPTMMPVYPCATTARHSTQFPSKSQTVIDFCETHNPCAVKQTDIALHARSGGAGACSMKPHGCAATRIYTCSHVPCARVRI